MNPTDIHAHIVPDDYLESGLEEAPGVIPRLTRNVGSWYLNYPSGHRSGPLPVGMFDTNTRISDMDRAGVTIQALSPPPTHFFYEHDDSLVNRLTQIHNDSMIRIAREASDRFVVLAGLPLQSEAMAHEELERLHAETCVRGVMIGTHIAGVSLDHPSLRSVWAALAEGGFAVVLHPHAVAGRERMSSHYLHNLVGNPCETTIAAGALMFGGVMAECPALRVALLHGGGFLPYQIGRFDHGWKVRTDDGMNLVDAPSTLFKRFYFDSLTHDPLSLKFLYERVGSGRVCLGSDYPFDMADPYPVRSVSSALEEPESVRNVLEATPTAFLKRG